MFGGEPRPDDDAAHRRVALGTAVRRRTHVVRPAASRTLCGEPQAHDHVDAAHGQHSAVPQAEHEQPSAGHSIYPYLPRTLAITCSNHVGAMDISYIPMARGSVYLAAVIDWHSRRVLASTPVDLDGHGVRHRGRRRWRSLSTASRRSSTPTRAVNSGSWNRRNIDFSNMRRPQSSHRARTPDEVCFASVPQPWAEAT